MPLFLVIMIISVLFSTGVYMFTLVCLFCMWVVFCCCFFLHVYICLFSLYVGFFSSSLAAARDCGTPCISHESVDRIMFMIYMRNI